MNVVVDYERVGDFAYALIWVDGVATFRSRRAKGTDLQFFNSQTIDFPARAFEDLQAFIAHMTRER